MDALVPPVFVCLFSASSTFTVAQISQDSRGLQCDLDLTSENVTLSGRMFWSSSEWMCIHIYYMNRIYIFILYSLFIHCDIHIIQKTKNMSSFEPPKHKQILMKYMWMSEVLCFIGCYCCLFNFGFLNEPQTRRGFRWAWNGSPLSGWLCWNCLPFSHFLLENITCEAIKLNSILCVLFVSFPDGVVSYISYKYRFWCHWFMNIC